MVTQDIQGLAKECAEIVLEDGKIGAIMAIRAYGACLQSPTRPSLRTVEKFYDALKPLLADVYRTKLSHLSSHECLAVEQAVARRIYDVIQDMQAGCIR